MTATPTNIAGASDNTDEPGRQRKRGAELEQAIRDATIAELACGGYGKVTIESVAARAQTGKASIYRRWPTKQDLVVDSIGCLLSGPLLSMAGPQLDDSVDTRDALLHMVRQGAAAMVGPSGDAIRSIMSESLRDQEFSTTFECDYYDPRKQALIGLLERGVQRGEVRPDAVSRLVPDVLAGTLIYRFLVRRQQPSDAELVEFVDGFIMPAIRPV
ncbi:MAG: TetR/AcrR family transcriptional regulator [Actinomycetota bacterium]|nr:TetR/AcrR family transcriptional regulator [Actinomycetota bacterium]MDQ2956036.1 TetR/AcrR family transcriptional regulator [Actinomycetota bacterium]